MNDKSEQKGLIAAIREHLARLHAERATLTSLRDDARKEIESLYAAPVCRDDAMQFCLDYIDAQAADWPKIIKTFSNAVDRATWPRRYDVPSGTVPGITKTTALNLRDIDAGLSGDYSRANSHFNDGLQFFGAGSATARFDGVYYFFFGDLIKAKLREHFDEFYVAPPSATVGPPIGQRRERILELEKSIADLEAKVGEIDAEISDIRAGTAPDPKPTPSQVTAPARKPTATEERQRDYAIYRAFNGRNADALAERHGVSVAHVNRIASAGIAPEL